MAKALVNMQREQKLMMEQMKEDAEAIKAGAKAREEKPKKKILGLKSSKSKSSQTNSLAKAKQRNQDSQSPIRNGQLISGDLNGQIFSGQKSEQRGLNLD